MEEYFEPSEYEFTQNQSHKILNPFQRQFLEDTKRVKERMSQLQTDGLGSPTNLYLRPNEEEDDTRLLDKHDSFYVTTKSLLVLFQIMGVMPIMRTPEGQKGERTTFSWTSKAFMWAYFIYGLETVVVIVIARDRIHRYLNNPDKKFDEVIYNIIFMSILIPHFLLPVASWRNGLEVAKFKNMWTKYQLKYLKVMGEPIVFPKLYPISWTLCLLSWGISALMVISQYFLQPDFPLSHTFAYYHIIAMLNAFCSLWYINCTAFGTTSRAFAKKLKYTLQCEKPAQILTKYRHLWVDLSHTMQQLGKAYSNMYGIYCLVIFFTTIISTYGCLTEILDHGATFKELGLFLIAVYFMTLLFIICNEAHHASRRVGLKFQEILLNVNSTAVDNDTQKEIEMFLVAIHKNPPTMNLDGYANIDRRLITSNVSFMVTYLVVLMQFKLTLVRQAAKQALIEKLRANMTRKAF